MTLHRFTELSDWELEDKDQDIRGRTLVTSEGREVGEVKDLAVDLESRHVVAVVTDMGESYAVDGLDIEPERVVTRRPPISGGTSTDEAAPGDAGYFIRIVQLQ